ncbi:MAG: hypothetical protein HC831_25485 [Chloroflexia bacterium]|nr:hypothetical protein [Chloroflexia bacterium]
MRLINKEYYPDKKFTEVFKCDEWEVETQEGWADILAVGKTVPYDVWELRLSSGKILRCADEHIIIRLGTDGLNRSETFVKDLEISDLVFTKKGFEKVDSVIKLDIKENMYDLEIDSSDHLYYTNDILSHNSLWIQNLAALSAQNGYNTAYITLELQEELVNMRFGANILSIPIDDYEETAKDQDLLRKKLQNAKNESFKPWGVLHTKEFPSSTASVPDIKAYLIKMEEILGIKFDNVFIDYINIMRNWRNPNSENTYIKIKQISEDLRAMAMEQSWAVITVTQTNKDGWENEDLRISNVSESSALLHTVDALFGIITSPEMKARKMYYLKYLADRVSGMENTRKKYNIDTKYMRITEDKNSDIEDLDFVLNSTVGHGKTAPRGSSGAPSSGISQKTFSEKDSSGNVSGMGVF